MFAIARTAALCAALISLVCSVAYAQAPKPSKPAGIAPAARIEGVVNINTATAAELELLPGVGPARARAILEHRKAKGEFKAVEDLREITGIGDRALEQLRPHCVTTGKTTAHRPD